jgi:hypothetical protein
MRCYQLLCRPDPTPTNAVNEPLRSVTSDSHGRLFSNSPPSPVFSVTSATTVSSMTGPLQSEHNVASALAVGHMHLARYEILLTLRQFWTNHASVILILLSVLWGLAPLVAAQNHTLADNLLPTTFRHLLPHLMFVHHVVFFSMVPILVLCTLLFLLMRIVT